MEWSSVLNVALKFWLCLFVYNVISALFGFCFVRRLYVHTLRTLYRVRCVYVMNSDFTVMRLFCCNKMCLAVISIICSLSLYSWWG